MTRLICIAALLVSSGKVFAEQASDRPFNGKDLKGWTTKEPKSRSHWKVGVATLQDQDQSVIKLGEAASPQEGELVNTLGRGVDIYTLEKFGDVRIELEVMVPQGSNSGIYVMGEYEVQVFDSYRKSQLGGGDMGAIYGAAPPNANAQKKPGDWNKYVIEFRAPRFDKSGKRTAKAKFVQVTLNGKRLHENVEMNGPTPAGVTGKESAKGPLMFQGDHGPVAFRRISITPLDP